MLYKYAKIRLKIYSMSHTISGFIMDVWIDGITDNAVCDVTHSRFNSISNVCKNSMCVKYSRYLSTFYEKYAFLHLNGIHYCHYILCTANILKYALKHLFLWTVMHWKDFLWACKKNIYKKILHIFCRKHNFEHLNGIRQFHHI